MMFEKKKKRPYLIDASQVAVILGGILFLVGCASAWLNWSNFNLTWSVFIIGSSSLLMSLASLRYDINNRISLLLSAAGGWNTFWGFSYMPLLFYLANNLSYPDSLPLMLRIAHSVAWSGPAVLMLSTMWWVFLSWKQAFPAYRAEDTTAVDSSKLQDNLAEVQASEADELFYSSRSEISR